MLAGCEQGAEVTVVQHAGAVAIAATRIRSSKPACLATVSLYGDAGTAPLWHIEAAPEAACTRRVTLGEVPPGFTADAASAVRLDAGGRYRVEVSGNGFTGAARFTAAR